MAIRVLNVPPEHPLNRLSEPLKKRIVAAQSDGLESEFSSAYRLTERALSDLKIAIKPPELQRGYLRAILGTSPLRSW